MAKQLFGQVGKLLNKAGKAVDDEIIELGWQPAEILVEDAFSFLTQPRVALALAVCGSALVLAPKKHKQFWFEFVGTVVMILATFSPHPFFNHHGEYEVWVAHFAGVLFADYLCGGPEVNPGVTICKFFYQKLSLLDVVVHIMAQMAGGIIAFPLLQAIASPYGVTIGGAEVAADVPVLEAMWSEAMTMFLLMMGIFCFAFTRIGNFYYVKQPLIAFVIRYGIHNYGKTGPSINPMGATTWLFYKNGAWPTDAKHYLVYWVASVCGGFVAVMLWSYLTGTGPFEHPEAKAKAEARQDANACLAAAWGRHTMALREKDTVALLATYSQGAVLLESARGANGKRAAKENVARVTEYTGKDQIKKPLETLVSELTNLTVLNTFLKMDGNSKSVFFKWECPSSGILHVSESLVFDADFKILCHHRSIERAGPISNSSSK